MYKRDTSNDVTTWRPPSFTMSHNVNTIQFELGYTYGKNKNVIPSSTSRQG
jgi:hypothetical protein